MAKKIIKTRKGQRVIVKPIEPKDLPRDAKVAMVHALRDLGISVRNISDNLGIAKGSVEQYIKENPDAKWDDFGTAIKGAVMVKEEEGAAATLEAMLVALPDSKLYEMTKLYEMLRTLRLPKDLVPGVPIPAGGIHFHSHEKVIQIVDRAEKELEEHLRQEIKDE